MFKLSILLLFVILFSGCRESSLVKEEILDVQIVDINPPKHFYIHVNIDNQKEKIHISKHCNNMKKNLINSNTKIIKKTYEYKDNKEQYYMYNKYYDAKEYCN